MIDSILYVPDTSAFSEYDPMPDGATHTNGTKALIYTRTKEPVTDERVTVLAYEIYTGTGTADRLYEYIQQRGELNALYHEVVPLKQLYWTDPETGEVDYDAAMGTEFVKFGMLAESTLPVPKAVSARQGMEQLIRLGLDEQVDDAIADIEDVVQRKIVRNWLDKAGEWERDNPQFVAFAKMLGLTDAQTDDYMRTAAEL
ncbi:hypothetical protein ELY33_17235 [Vreelandella andesensis]|uniref:Uncharacterized protein n=1 Tax=Vreelandella andesensis TaxID=447567 RepID=A0A3S0YCH8_9GAMM|nr:hypothetical protein [Halomonas andesensis]RUR26852.1 hypothetical protein ELY33_17235 [Halomonas andesensis]